MQKLLLLFFSLALSFNSYGEWTEISSNVKGDSYYINLETIKKINGYVNYWQLDDSASGLQSGEIYSAKSKIEINCIDEGMRMKGVIYYSENMGKGEIYFTDNSPPTDWGYPPPSSSYFKLLSFACDYVDWEN